MVLERGLQGWAGAPRGLWEEVAALQMHALRAGDTAGQGGGRGARPEH